MDVSSSIKIIVTMPTFLSSATQTLQQLQPEHKPTMAIAKHRSIDSCYPCNQPHLQTEHKLQQLNKQPNKQHDLVGCLPYHGGLIPSIATTFLLDTILIQLNPSTTRTCGWWREQRDSIMLAMFLIADVMLAKVLTEDMLVLLMMIEDYYVRPWCGILSNYNQNTSWQWQW